MCCLEQLAVERQDENYRLKVENSSSHVTYAKFRYHLMFVNQGRMSKFKTILGDEILNIQILISLSSE